MAIQWYPGHMHKAQKAIKENPQLVQLASSETEHIEAMERFAAEVMPHFRQAATADAAE